MRAVLSKTGAAAVAELPEAAREHAFIGRQPVLDRQQQISGYELFFRSGADATEADFAEGIEADMRVLVNTLSNMGTAWLLGDKLAFLNVSHDMLQSDFLELLPALPVVLDVSVPPRPSPELFESLQHARMLGLKICLDDFMLFPEAGKYLELASYVKLDIRRLGLRQLPEISRLLRKYPLKQIATKVETREEFEACKKAGVDAFQGYYFARPVTLSAKTINPGYANLLALLKMVRNNEEVRDIEEVLKRDVALSFKLLRFINSTGFGLSCEIQSFRHAVTILGYAKLERWLSLLLVTAGKNSAPPALMKTAVTRGRLVELLGQSCLEENERDNLFIVGVFSLLDAMLEMPMETVLEQLCLPEAIGDALLSRQGIYWPFLELAMLCEEEGMERAGLLADALQLTAAEVNKAHLESLGWVELLGI